MLKISTTAPSPARLVPRRGVSPQPPTAFQADEEDGAFNVVNNGGRGPISVRGRGWRPRSMPEKLPARRSTVHDAGSRRSIALIGNRKIDLTLHTDYTSEESLVGSFGRTKGGAEVVSGAVRGNPPAEPGDESQGRFPAARMSKFRSLVSSLTGRLRTFEKLRCEDVRRFEVKWEVRTCFIESPSFDCDLNFAIRTFQNFELIKGSRVLEGDGSSGPRPDLASKEVAAGPSPARRQVLGSHPPKAGILWPNGLGKSTRLHSPCRMPLIPGSTRDGGATRNCQGRDGSSGPARLWSAGGGSVGHRSGKLMAAHLFSLTGSGRTNFSVQRNP